MCLCARPDPWHLGSTLRSIDLCRHSTGNFTLLPGESRQFFCKGDAWFFLELPSCTLSPLPRRLEAPKSASDTPVLRQRLFFEPSWRTNDSGIAAQTWRQGKSPSSDPERPPASPVMRCW